MSIDASALAQQMIGAGAQAFGPDWREAKDLAKGEFKTLARRIKEIGRLAAGGLDAELAKTLLAMQKNVAIQIIAGATTLTLLAVESAINAVFDVIKSTVNAALGITLL